jgi:malate dehydrogenase (oxaloacetate-decarboxylating)(NADP+)
MDSSIDKKEELRQQLRAAALEYHQFPRPGKISVTPTKSAC